MPLARALWITALAFATAGAQTPPAFSLVGSPQVGPGQELIDLYFKVTSPELRQLKITDVTQGSAVTLREVAEPTLAGIAEVASVGAPSQTSYWRTKWKLVGLLPGTQDSRVFKLTYGMRTDMLIVVLAARSAADITVAVKGPDSPLQLRYGRETAVRIGTKSALTGIKVSQALLTEKSTSRPLTDDLMELVRSGQAIAGGELSLSRPMETLVLRIKPGFAAAGNYIGTVQLTSNEKPDLGSFPLTVQSTSWADKGLGLLALIAGFLLFCAVAIWAKSRARQIQALLPASRLSEEVTHLIHEVNAAAAATDYAFPTLLNQNLSAPGSLNRLASFLTKAHLTKQGFLPPAFMLPFGSQDLPGPYQSFLLSTGSQLSNMGLLVRWGIASVVTRWNAVVSVGPSGLTAGLKALADLDQLAIYAGPPDQLVRQIQAVLTTLNTALLPPPPGGAPAAGRSPVLATSQHLSFELQELSLFVWIAWGVLTIAIGATTMILFNASFGVPQDFLQCFLWGASVPGVANGLGALSQGAVTTAFSLQLPR